LEARDIAFTSLSLWCCCRSVQCRWNEVPRYGNYRNTESQNSRGWKGPLWVI